jgi:hypothetical protein
VYSSLLALELELEHLKDLVQGCLRVFGSKRVEQGHWMVPEVDCSSLGQEFGSVDLDLDLKQAEELDLEMRPAEEFALEMKLEEAHSMDPEAGWSKKAVDLDHFLDLKRVVELAFEHLKGFGLPSQVGHRPGERYQIVQKLDQVRWELLCFRARLE